MTARSRDGDGLLWPDRYLTDGRILIRRSPRDTAGGPDWLERFRGWVVELDWLAWVGREWLRLTSTTQWVIGLLLVALTAGLGLLLPLAGVLLYRHRQDQADLSPATTAPVPPEVALATWDTTEARVAGAATRAWLETLSEPSWHSPFLARSRAAFDGQAEVDQIVDLALRIRDARVTLGTRPAGAAAEYWDRQTEALENAATQLGRRADTLIRYRDQAALLSVELQQLTDLERLERSAAEIDGLTIETAYPSGRGDAGMRDVAAEIAGVRAAMTELVDLMTRTLTPLHSPPSPPPAV